MKTENYCTKVWIKYQISKMKRKKYIIILNRNVWNYFFYTTFALLLLRVITRSVNVLD